MEVEITGQAKMETGAMVPHTLTEAIPVTLLRYRQAMTTTNGVMVPTQTLNRAKSPDDLIAMPMTSFAYNPKPCPDFPLYFICNGKTSNT